MAVDGNIRQDTLPDIPPPEPEITEAEKNVSINLPDGVGVSQRWNMTLQEFFDTSLVRVSKPLLDSEELTKRTISVPEEVHGTIHVFMKELKITSSRDVIATLLAYGRAINQHKYNKTITSIERMHNELYHSDTKSWDKIQRQPETRIEESVAGGRNRVNVIGDSKIIMAPIGDYHRILKISFSDVALMDIEAALLEWVGLPELYRTRFTEHLGYYDSAIQRRLMQYPQYRATLPQTTDVLLKEREAQSA